MKTKIGIMGGTFDPIHLGHLILAEETRVHFNLDKVVFIPSGRPPHKNWDDITEPYDRYEMTLLATNDNPYFFVSTMEIEREGLTYTVDTIKRLKKENKDAEYYFITGADSLVDIYKWKNHEELLKLCKFVTVKRIGIPNSQLENLIDKINKEHRDTAYLLTIPYIDISSTGIRNRVKRGKSIKYYVPEEVERYIKKKKLYIE